MTATKLSYKCNVDRLVEIIEVTIYFLCLFCFLKYNISIYIKIKYWGCFIMIKCEICNKEFKNNMGGNLTVHIENEHGLSAADYFIKFYLNGIEPKCQCGYCDERPNFRRGKFSKFAIGHEKHEWYEISYIRKYGQPKCQNPKCDNIVKFTRGKPNKFCYYTCQPSYWNQNKVNSTVKEKYNVDNVFQLDSVKEKSKITSNIKYGVDYPSQSLYVQNIMKQTNIERYGVDFPQKLVLVKNKQKQILLKKYGVDR
jgi:hypothetical protein